MGRHNKFMSRKRMFIPITLNDERYIKMLKDVIEESYGSLNKMLKRTELTYKNWCYIIEQIPELEEYRQKIASINFSIAEDKLAELIDEKFWPAIKFLLERKSDKYQEKKIIKVLPAKEEDDNN